MMTGSPNHLLTESFRSEVFVPIGGHTGFSGFAELLFQHDDAERFFKSATHGQIHHIFLQAVQNKGRFSKTINIQPAALFDPNFLPLLLRELRRFSKIERQKICIEITEHGGIPENFNKKLLAFLKYIDLKLALDDFDPRNAEELKRLECFGPYMDIIKFPYQVMEALRDPETRTDMSDKIRAACKKYPDRAFVMEGIGENEPEAVKTFLRDLGIDYVQISAHQTRIQSAPVLALVS